MSKVKSVVCITNEELVHKIQNNLDVNVNVALLWQQNVDFVKRIANQYQGYAEFEDLLQEGFIGMYTAVFKYDLQKNSKFLTYAEYWIKTRMQRFITQKNSVIRVPDGRRQQIRQYLKAVSEYEKYMGRKPYKHEIANVMGLCTEEIEKIKEDARCLEISSLDMPVDDEEQITFGQLLPGCNGIEDAILDRNNDNELKSVLWSIVDELPEVQPTIIHSVYGEGKLRREVAEQIGSTEWIVRREESKALRTLRHPKNSNRLRVYMDDYVPGQYNHVGVQQFNRTWTSSVEREILRQQY